MNFIRNYTYLWLADNGFNSNDQDIYNLAGGNYTLTIIDNNGCVATENILINSFVGNQNIKNDLYNLLVCLVRCSVFGKCP